MMINFRAICQEVNKRKVIRRILALDHFFCV